MGGRVLVSMKVLGYVGRGVEENSRGIKWGEVWFLGNFYVLV